MAREHGAPASVLAKLMPRASAAEDFAGDDDFTDGEDVESVDTAAPTVAGIRVNRNAVATDSFDNAMAAVLECGFKPQFNLLSQKVEFHEGKMPKSIGRGGELTDNVVRVIRDHLVAAYQGNAYNPSKDNVREAVMTIALRNRFNPLLNYLDSLQWDGVERLGWLFPDYFHCEDSEYARAVSLCFTIGAVRRVRRPGSKFDTMPVIKGPQGWNKSSGVRALFGKDFYTDAAINIRDKDASLITRGIWVLEVAELDAMRRPEAASLKAWLARAVDRQRDPYGTIVEDFPRSWVCIGTTNEGSYLKDATGARRFWPLTITKRVDVKRLAADRDQLWAEAAAREARGESDILPRKLWAAAAEHQERETSQDPWTNTLGDFLAERAREAAREDREDFDGPPLPPDRVLASELYDALDIDPAKRTREQGQRMRVVMEGLGWTYRLGVRVLDKAQTGYVMQA
jgi:predicted P-loop ATPase